MKILVLIPTYNEIETLRHSVENLISEIPNIDVLIIDDNSPDGTGSLADQLASEYVNVTVLHRKKKEGLGRAYSNGFALGLQRSYDLLVEMDADGSHRPVDLKEMIAVASNHDLVIGSRWIAGGAVSNWSWVRQLISRLGNGYAAFMLKSKVRDMTSGFRIYKSGLLRELPIEKTQAHGYAFQVEMTFLTESLGKKILEVPILFVEREGGKSKMTMAIVLEAFLLCTKWGLSRPRR